MLIRYGIVLVASSAFKSGVTILDQHMGMIDVVLEKKHNQVQMNHGFLVRYTLHDKGSGYMIKNSRVIAQPAHWVYSDIHFLHHFLEIARNFLMYHDPAQVIFDHCSYLFKNVPYDQDSDHMLYFKQFFLCKIFFLMGICPEDTTTFSSTFFSLISGSLDTMVKAHNGSVKNSELVRWLHGCIAVHPRSDRFKTIYF